MLDKVVYVSGVQGSGKSTLIRELCDTGNCISSRRISSRVDGNKHEFKDRYSKAIWRLAKYYLEACEQACLSKNNPNNFILGDRSVYDSLVYMNAFLQLGWVNEDQLKHHQKLYELFFSQEMKPKNIIFVAPPLEWIIKKLEERSKTESLKPDVKNLKYLKLVYDAFESFYQNCGDNVLILRETDLEQRVKIVREWLGKIYS